MIMAVEYRNGVDDEYRIESTDKVVYLDVICMNSIRDSVELPLDVFENLIAKLGYVKSTEILK